MIDFHKALSVAEEAAKLAGERIIRGYNEDISFTIKTDKADRVTQVDHDCQKIIFDVLQKEFPDHSFLGEEDGEENEGEQAEYHWIVDPLDGTMNFTHRLPFAGPSIAL